MRRDPTEFRQRFAAWKDGENYWDTREYMLPEYSGGKTGRRSRFQYTMDSEHFEANPYVDDVGVKTSGYGFTRNMDTIKNAQDRSYTKEEARRVLEKEMDHRLQRTYGYLNPDIRQIIQSNQQLEEMLGDALWQSPNGYGGKKSSLVAALNSRSLYGDDEQAYWNNIAAQFTRGNYYTKKDGTRIRLGGVIKRNNARAQAFKNMYKPKQKKASTITEPIVNNLEQVERPLMLPDHPVLQTPLQAAEQVKLPKTIQRNLEHQKYPVLGNDYWENFLNNNSLSQFQSLISEQMTGYKHGKSPIRINPANRGKFNALKKRTGKTTEQLTHSKNPLTRKRAIFAQNAAKWRRK